jgi:glycosyltransferase involved in cell wall biosynthesis
MKILALVNTLQFAGGVETSLLHKATAWVRAGHEVEVSTLEHGARDFHAFPSEVRRVSLGVAYDARRRLLSPRNLRAALHHAWALRKLIRRAKPDVVVNCIYGYSFYLLPLVAPAGVKLVSENHSSRKREAAMATSAAARMKRSIRALFDSLYDWSVFLSREEAEVARGRNVCVIPNPVPSLSPDMQFPEKKSRIIAAGRICRVKGFDRLIDAWALARYRLPGWTLHIYGDGELDEVDALVRLARRRGVGSSVELFPATADILERIAESRIFAMASRSECFPMVLLEAMQLGAPVVAYDCPTGPRNIVQNGVTGVLVDDGDIQQFADALVALAQDESRQQEIVAAARLESHRYEVTQVMPLWARLFEGRL